ncbi:hypothetical protein M514_01102 [Trichuris suis]|uniref:Uncharacterized protein n=1 Tax=Trichuris suis TaxID=68888 RepID=A0A085MZE0_9BILA|nr:hypothetical protein M514_01102 [Trichuris suis]
MLDALRKKGNTKFVAALSTRREYEGSWCVENANRDAVLTGSAGNRNWTDLVKEWSRSVVVQRSKKPMGQKIALAIIIFIFIIDLFGCDDLGAAPVWITKAMAPSPKT